MFRFLAVLIVPAFVALPVVAQDKGYASFIAKAKGALTKDFKDPEGSRYRNLGVYRSLDKSLALCGEVNAKNSYGAYVGYKQFYADDKNGTIKEEGDELLFNTLGKAYCDKKLADAK
ncbi:hypothetical protein [Acidovorax sp.]|uniref:hypothetical protein n=1 Tax=Acidovorax sp. TaxID=1872122 RepID=UPI003D00EEA5